MNVDAWQKERQAYWDRISDNNAKFYTRDVRTTSYRSSDEYYYGLNQAIEIRQQEKVPIAGEGYVEFWTSIANVSALGSKVFPPLRLVTLASRGLLAIEEFKN